jgi:hypothetical protein
MMARFGNAARMDTSLGDCSHFLSRAMHSPVIDGSCVTGARLQSDHIFIP